mgnify:CR=1 FL=1
MSDLIRRSTLLKSIKGVEVSWYLDNGVCGDNYDDTTIVDIINVQPTIEAVPVVRGEWIKKSIQNINGNTCMETWHCSNCDWVYDKEDEPYYDFCPNCGADMRKGGAE